MQIEIPSFDEDIPAPAFAPSFGGPSTSSSSSHHHRRDQSNPVAELPFSFPGSAVNASRPFGGIHAHPAPSSLHHHHHHNGAAGSPVSEISTPGLGPTGGMAWEMRRKQSAASNSTATTVLSAGQAGQHGRMGSNGVVATPMRNGVHKANGSDVFGNGSGGRSRSNTGVGSSSGSAEGHAPLEVAVYLIMDRFLEECETRISQLLGRAIPATAEDDIYIASYLGPNADPAFDGVFDSLSQVAKRDPRSVVNCVMRWKSRQSEGIDEGAIQRAVAASGNTASARKVAIALSERKGVALVYLLCRALITIVQGVSRDALGEDIGKRLEDIVFNSIKNADPYVTARNPNKQSNMTMFAQLLGALSNIRFTSVSDRFTAEIDLMNRNAALRDTKGDMEARLGYVIKGVQYLKLKVYPLEAFEETADFIASFASIFDASRGNFVKTAMAETLGPLLAQVAESATAEVNHPVWNRAIQIIFAKAHSMSDKPSKARYWPATVPLLCACIGAAPQDFLTAKWTETIDWCFGRMKEKQTRAVMMLGVVQLVWSYLHRVKEGASALNKRLEPILKSAFPPDRKNAYPAEVSLDSFASLLHYILHWQLEYGSDFVLRNLLGGSGDAADPGGASPVAQAGPDRIMIAITASIRALTSLAKGVDPAYPSLEGKMDDPRVPAAQREDAADGNALEPDFLEKPRIKAFVDAAGTRVLQLAASCDRALAAYTLADDRLVYPWHEGIAQRPEVQETHVLRRHGAFAVEYPRDRQPYFDVLESCLQAWPRLLQSPAAESAALDILFRGLLSLDVSVAVESKFCLRRFLMAGKAYSVLQAFTRFIGRPDLTFRIKSGLQKASDIKLEALVKLWVEGMSTWCDELRKARAEDQLRPMYQDGLRLAGAVEATSLVLLCSRSPAVRRLALDASRIVASARGLLQDAEPSTPTSQETKSIANLLDEAEARFFDTITGDDLAAPEKTRLTRWRKQRRGEALTRLLESDHAADATLFYCALTSVYATALAHAPQIITHVRSLLLGALQRIYPVAADAAGLGKPTTAVGATAPPPGSDDRQLLLSWTSLLISLISVTTSSATKVGTISIGIDSSSSNLATRDRVSPGDEMIRTTLPFLTSDQTAYREAAVRALSSVHISMYPGLLEGLAGLAQHLTGERKMAEMSKDRNVRTSPRTVRLFLAIGRIHENTTSFLHHPNFTTNERTVEILLRFIKETCLFLRARPTADDGLFVAIRKSFCNYCERVLVLLARSKDVHRFFHSDLLGDMFNLAEEWTLKTGGPDSPAMRHHPQSRGNSVSSGVVRPLAMKTRSSSASSVTGGFDLMLPGATMIATLCEGALDVRHASTMTRRPEAARFRPSVSSNRLLRWVILVFERPDPKVHALARRAFVGAARTTSDPDGLFDAALSRCWLEPDVLPLSQTLFGIVSSALLSDPTLKVQPAAIVTLGIARIAHMDLATRQRALDLLSRRAMSPQFSTWVPDIEAGIQSAFSGQHLVAQYQICAAISQLQTVDACDIIAELASRIVQLEPHRSRFMARLLPLWLTYVDLGPTVADIASPRAREVLTNLLLISSRLGDSQPDEIRSLWSSLASNLHPLNSAAVITFLLEQTTRRANPAFVRIARIILSCVAEASGAEAVIKDLSASIQPANLLSSGSTAPSSPEGHMPSQRTTDLEVFYPQLPSRTVLSPMQAAILLLGEAMVLRPSALGDRLPTLLHAYMVQADHTNTILRSQMRDALIRYVGMLRRLQGTADVEAAVQGEAGEGQEGWQMFWDFEDMGSSRRNRRAPSNMEHLLDEVLRISARLSPDFRDKWGQVAVEWATLCPVRHVACRSLQVLRILAPQLDANAVGELLVRLSNTAADPSPEIQVFALEVLQTLTSSVRAPGHTVPVAQLFWAGVACLETTNDLEFQEALQLLRIVAEQADEAISADIATARPSTFDGTELLSAIAIKGLRSAPLCHPSWLLIRALLSMPHFAEILDWDHGLPLVYAALLPWGLQNLEAGVPPDHLEEVATGLAELATRTGREGIARVMTSFAKRRFRTNEDFLRQAVGSLREYYLPLEAPSLLVLLIGLLFNPLSWLRARTMAVVKLLLRLVDPTSPEVSDLGYDLLTPILSLLQTDVAPQALEVLAEPLPVRAPAVGGRKALAMLRGDDAAVGPRVFGTPDDTGWCVADPQSASFATRRALGDVIDAFSASAPTRRPSLVEFASEWTAEPDHAASEAQSQSDIAETNESFGDMVSALHNLSDFFGQDAGSPSSRLSSPISPSSARVAAILSRSLSKRRANRPSLRLAHHHHNPSGSGQQLSSSTLASSTGPSSSPTAQRRRRPPSTFAASVASHRPSASTGDILEEEDEEEEEEDDDDGFDRAPHHGLNDGNGAPPFSPAETDDVASDEDDDVDEDEMIDLAGEGEDERYRHSSLVHRRKSRPPDALPHYPHPHHPAA